MTLRSAIDGFLDKTVDAHFKRDGEERLVFFPMGYGSGRIVPDAEAEATLRIGSRRLTIATFVVLIPLIAATQALFPLKGVDFLAYFLGCGALGFASQLYPMWLARGLPRSPGCDDRVAGSFRTAVPAVRALDLERNGGGGCHFSCLSGGARHR
jgi:hypothetical protein